MHMNELTEKSSTRNMKKDLRQIVAAGRRHSYQLLFLFAAIVFALLPAVALASTGQAGRAYTFKTLNNNADPTFNQLLGINNHGVIAGYFGSGATGHPNKGYTLSPPYGQGNYKNENFPGSVQTQVFGINNNPSATTVGFWVDANGNNFGFAKQGATFTNVAAPTASPTTSTAVGRRAGSFCRQST